MREINASQVPVARKKARLMEEYSPVPQYKSDYMRRLVKADIPARLLDPQSIQGLNHCGFYNQPLIEQKLGLTGTKPRCPNQQDRQEFDQYRVMMHGLRGASEHGDVECSEGADRILSQLKEMRCPDAPQEEKKSRVLTPLRERPGNKRKAPLDSTAASNASTLNVPFSTGLRVSRSVSPPRGLFGPPPPNWWTTPQGGINWAAVNCAHFPPGFPLEDNETNREKCRKNQQMAQQVPLVQKQWPSTISSVPQTIVPTHTQSPPVTIVPQPPASSPRFGTTVSLT